MLFRRYLFVLIIILTYFNVMFLAPLQAVMLDRPKIGLVLSGGGAKGFAHIGVLKMLDSLEIPVDYIAGTSMGGIIGALYAIGYRGEEIEDLVIRTDWQEIFTDQPPRELLPYFQKLQTGRYQLEFGLENWRLKPPSGLIFGQKISLLFSSLTFPYERVSNFDELPIPFRCVAVDLKTGNQVILDKGSLAKAMRSTMAIPTAFSPVAWGDSLLVDGGILNNLPVDVVKDMGADIIIAVDVANIEANDASFDNILKVLDRSISLLGVDRWRENRKRADIFIAPDLEGYGLADFTNGKIMGILRQGGLAAQANEKRLLDLKQRFALARVSNPTHLMKSLHDNVRIHGIQITGQKSLQFHDIYQRLGCEPNTLFNPRAIDARLTNMRLSGYVQNITYETIPVSDDYVRLVFHVEERDKPQIQGIRIYGNRTLPFGFIYRLLGINPGDFLNTNDLNRRIMTLYGLGYFESIRYDLEPVSSHRVRLKLHVKEKPLRRWRFGVRYDNHHKIVGSVMSQANNIPFAGMRLESEFQFMGLIQAFHRGYYPSRSLAFPLYPFYAISYKDIPVSIYGPEGNRIAEYKDRSVYTALGVGFLLRRSFSLEMSYAYESIFVEPRIAMNDPVMFPEFDYDLYRVDVRMRLDHLDDVFVPRYGTLMFANYEGSFEKIGSEDPYQLFESSLNVYQTYKKNHTIRLTGYFADGTEDLPIYKYPNQGHPDRFIGMGYDQLTGNSFSFVRLEYRYEWNPFVYLKLMANRTLHFDYRIDGDVYGRDNLWGAGAGLMIATPAGPFDMVVSAGSKSTDMGGVKARYYVTFGAKF